MIATTVFPLKFMGFPLVRINIEESVSSIFSPRDFSGRLSRLGPSEVSISIVYGSHERLLSAVSGLSQMAPFWPCLLMNVRRFQLIKRHAPTRRRSSQFVSQAVKNRDNVTNPNIAKLPG